MTNNCTYPHCDPTIACNLGEARPEDCPHWRLSNGSASDPSEGNSDEVSTQTTELRLPWTGQALGVHDLPLLSGRTRPLLVGLIGPQGAGKSTLLATLALLLGRGQAPEGWRFAGSLTIAGWRALTMPLQWQADAAPRFPPHTSLNSGRVPGLLHLAMRHGESSVRDLLFADAPGEWFSRWAITRDDPAADGARWVLRHAGALLLFADQDALGGKQRGAARALLIDLARRLHAERADRPLAVVWAKSDRPISEDLRQILDTHFAQLLTPFSSFHTAVKGEPNQREAFNREFLDLVAWLLTVRPAERAGITPIGPTDTADPFLAYRGG